MGKRNQEGDHQQEVAPAVEQNSALRPDMAKPSDMPKSGDQGKAEAACVKLNLETSANPVQDLPVAGSGKYWSGSHKKLVDLTSADGNHTIETWAAKNNQELMTRKTDFKSGRVDTEFDYSTAPKDFTFYRNNEAGSSGEDIHLKGVTKMTFSTEGDHFKVKVLPPQKDASGNELDEFRVDKTGHYMGEGY